VNDTLMHIEIVYAEPQCAIIKDLRLPVGSCVADVLRLAALDPDFDAVDLVKSAFGIFGRRVQADQILKDGDRIEIYRPLAADPKTARRARAKQLGRPRPR
jgi:putative ubiquitin-RnfH superfamily antitoxin RatB of RatAB toxin-antitoxin module